MSEAVADPVVMPAYRSMMMDPQESLLLAHDAVAFASRWQEFAQRTGVPLDAILMDPICATPLPIYPPAFEGGRRRWAGVRAEAMWHPLLWLPDALAAHAIVDIDKGEGDIETGPEPDGLWAARVAFELMESRLYDADSGTWLDVLSLVGLDSTDPATIARVEAWLDGDDDSVLDHVDLSGYLHPDPAFALVEVGNSYGGLRRASIGLLALDLRGQLEEALGSTDQSAVLEATKTVAYLGAALRLSTGSPDPERAARLWDGAVGVLESSSGAGPVAGRDAELLKLIRGELDAVVEVNQQWVDDVLSGDVDTQ